MKGDYFRYICECTNGETRKKAEECSNEAYKAGAEKAQKNLKTTNPTRLGLNLNKAIFFYEIKKDPGRACQIAKETFDDATIDIHQMEDIHYNDVTTIMQLLTNNLNIWTSQMENKEDREDENQNENEHD